MHQELRIKRLTDRLKVKPVKLVRQDSASSTSSTDSVAAEFDRYRQKMHDPHRIHKEFTITTRRSRTATAVSRYEESISTSRKPKKSETPNIQVVGLPVVGGSVGHVRPVRYDTFTRKPQIKTTLPITNYVMNAKPPKFQRKSSVLEKLEEDKLKLMMTPDEIINEQRRLSAISAKRQQARANQTTPDWAKGATSMMAQPLKGKKAKVRVISKSMAANDVFI